MELSSLRISRILAKFSLNNLLSITVEDLILGKITTFFHASQEVISVFSVAFLLPFGPTHSCAKQSHYPNIGSKAR
jgi:hypothetical protein